jgi:hypothetical protein
MRSYRASISVIGRLVPDCVEIDEERSHQLFTYMGLPKFSIIPDILARRECDM